MQDSILISNLAYEVVTLRQYEAERIKYHLEEFNAHVEEQERKPDFLMALMYGQALAGNSSITIEDEETGESIPYYSDHEE